MHLVRIKKILDIGLYLYSDLNFIKLKVKLISFHTIILLYIFYDVNSNAPLNF